MRPGIPNALDPPLATLVDKVVLFPVVNGVIGTGTTARFDLVGFVGAKVCGYWISSHSKRTGQSLRRLARGSLLNAKPNPVRFIQFRYVSYSAGYSGGGPVCSFGDRTCQYAILSAQLYK